MRSFDVDTGMRPHPPRIGPLKVGYILKRFPRLSETFVLNEIVELERQGVEVEVFSLRRAKEEPRHAQLATLRARVTYLAERKTEQPAVQPTDAQVRLLEPLMPGKSHTDVRRLVEKACTIAELASERGIEHLHAHFASDATAAALVAAQVSGLPFSFTAHARDIFHCYISREIDDAVRRTKIHEARFVATVSDFNRSHLQHIAGSDAADRVVRLYNGIDIDNFAPDPSVERVRGSILCVGRLVEKKGIADLVEACRILRKRGLDFKCAIVGNGPLRPDIEAQIVAAGLQQHVTLHGALVQAQVRALMLRSEVMALPCVISESGDRDGLPTVLLEALASGLPAISTRVAGIPEIIEHERSGLLVEPNTPLQLADAIARLIMDRSLAKRLAAAGRARALEHFDLSTNVARLRCLFVEGPPGVQMPKTYPRSTRTDHAHRISLR